MCEEAAIGASVGRILLLLVAVRFVVTIVTAVAALVLLVVFLVVLIVLVIFLVVLIVLVVFLVVVFGIVDAILLQVSWFFTIIASNVAILLFVSGHCGCCGLVRGLEDFVFTVDVCARVKDLGC